MKLHELAHNLWFLINTISCNDFPFSAHMIDVENPSDLSLIRDIDEMII